MLSCRSGNAAKRMVVETSLSTLCERKDFFAKLAMPAAKGVLLRNDNRLLVCALSPDAVMSQRKCSEAHRSGDIFN